MVYKTVPLTESQVGKYIDTNGDGIPEGVIFADLAVGGKCYGEEIHNNYEIPTIKKGLKDYVIIGEYDDIINGKQEMLTHILDGEDRFYIMALKDFGDGMFSLYSEYISSNSFCERSLSSLNFFNLGYITIRAPYI